MIKQDQTAVIVLVNKPRGISSNSVVNIVKRATGAKKAGHMGTLDLEGEGLLPVLLNKATQLFDYYLNKDKVYRTKFQFGIETTTLDLEGDIVKTDDKAITTIDVERVIPSLIGRYPQMPPAYSAKRVNGKRAYDLARSGQSVELKPKEIEVYSIKLVGQTDFNVFEFEIHCSSGTYIRSIARDMAKKLSTCGVMQCIQRTRCGEFDLKDACTLEEVQSGKFKPIPIENLFDYPKVMLTLSQKEDILNGKNIFLTDGNGNSLKNGLYRVYFQDCFLGIVEIDARGTKFKFRFV